MIRVERWLQLPQEGQQASVLHKLFKLKFLYFYYTIQVSIVVLTYRMYTQP
jgi:hypothetical protein